MARCEHKWRVYRRSNTKIGTRTNYYQCGKCKATFTTYEVPKAEYDMFKRFRALVRLYPDYFFKAISGDESAASYDNSIYDNSIYDKENKL